LACAAAVKLKCVQHLAAGNRSLPIRLKLAQQQFQADGWLEFPA